MVFERLKFIKACILRKKCMAKLKMPHPPPPHTHTHMSDYNVTDNFVWDYLCSDLHGSSKQVIEIL